jgi:hypothetical protein
MTDGVTILALIIGVVLGVLSNAVWELVAKPGVTWLGRSIVWVATIGNKRLQDSLYAEAALDPTSMPSIYGVHLLVGGLIGLAAVLGLVIALIGSSGEAGVGHSRGWLFGPSRVSGLVVLAVPAIAVAITLGLAIKLALIRLPIAVRRTFIANFNICKPAMTEVEQSRLMASFSGMRTRQDYDALSKTLQDIASKNGITSLWASARL